MNAIEIKNFIKNKIVRTVNLVFPPHCPYCGARLERAHSICPHCFTKIRFISNPKCDRCGRPFDFEAPEKMICAKCLTSHNYYDKVRSAFIYDEFSRVPLLLFKHVHRTDLGSVLGHFLFLAGQELFPGTDAIVCVPMHRKRLWKRTYNQAAILSRFIGTKIQKPVLPHILQRTRATVSQGHMNAKGRKKNVSGAFHVKSDVDLKGQNILLIDDVFTTGATANECAKALKKAGAKRVFVLTVSMVVK